MCIRKTFLLGALLLLLPGAVGHTFAQGGRLTPFQEAYLRQLFYARSNVYEAAAINAATWTNWYHGNSNLWDYMLSRTNDWNVGVTNLPPNWLSVSNWAAIGLTNLPPNWSTLSNAWTIGQTNLPGNWLVVSNAALNPAIAGVAWVASNQVFTGTNGFTNSLDLYTQTGPFSTNSAAWRFYGAASSTATNPVLLLHMNGADGSTTFADNGVNAHSMTANGSAQVDTAIKKYGSGSGLFNGSTDYVSTPTNADFDFGTGNFTLEFWIYPTASHTAYQGVLCDMYRVDGVKDIGWIINYNDANKLRFYGSSLLVEGGAIAQNVWTHIAAVRNGNTITLYTNGVASATGDATGKTFNGASSGLTVGRLYGNYNGYYFNGQIDDVRISKNQAMYTGTFTPPSTELADPAVDYSVVAIAPSGVRYQILPETNLPPNWVSVSNSVATNDLRDVRVERLGIGTNQFKDMLHIYGTDTHVVTADPFVVQTNGIALDGPENADKFLRIARNGTNGWDLGTYRDEHGEFFYIAREADVGSTSNGQHVSRIPVTISAGGRVGINKQPSQISYHSLYLGSGGLNDCDFTGAFTRTTLTWYEIFITSTNPATATDRWSWRRTRDSGATYTYGAFTNACATTNMVVDYGITCKFGSATGHLITDSWGRYAFPQLPQASLHVAGGEFTEILTTTNTFSATPTWVDCSYNLNYSWGPGVECLTTTNDAIYLGRDEVVNSIYVWLARAGEGVTLVMEYWNGSAWVALTTAANDLRDGTVNLSQSGRISSDKSTMTNAAFVPYSKDAGEGYYMPWYRLRTSTAPTVAPIIKLITPHGQFRIAWYAGQMDGLPRGYVDAQGDVSAYHYYRLDGQAYSTNELVTEDRVNYLISASQARYASTVWYFQTNVSTVVSDMREFTTNSPGGGFFLTNALATTPTTIGVFMTTSPLGVDVITNGQQFTSRWGASFSGAGGPTANMWYKLVEVHNGITNLIDSSTTSLSIPNNALATADINLILTVGTNTASSSTNFIGCMLMGQRTGGANGTLVTKFGPAFSSSFTVGPKK